MTRPIDVIADTRRAQFLAADPSASAWVAANAGTGKTYVLTQRVLRLMLHGAPIDRILCLTYTKAAAAEMAKRVFAELGKWAAASEPDLTAALADLMGRAPDAGETARARALFAQVIETPGGLKIQTIHAFAERLLRRFPLEAGAPPDFVTMDDNQAREAQREAIDEVLREAARAPRGRCGRALERAVAYAAGDAFDGILRAALAKRDWLDAMLRRSDKPEPWDDIGDLYRDVLGVRGGLAREAIDRELAFVMDDPVLRRFADALGQGSSTDRDAAEKIKAALSAPSTGARVAALEELFCTKEGKARGRLMTNAVKAAHPDLERAAGQAQSLFCQLLEERRALIVVEATLALIEIADAAMQYYASAKARRAALDFEDLVSKAAFLLSPASLGAAAWVHYRLDGGIDHILLDEAQDTSPKQWAIVTALADEFYSGRGARETPRTLFAVGDEKQSIYGFQGASPEMFMETGRTFAESAKGAGEVWRDVSLDVSFRTVSPVLTAVDQVFADRGRTPGLASARQAIAHRASRIGQAGLVELWPVETPDPREPADPWSPLTETPASEPVARLAARIADMIRDWIDKGERLLSENRPVRPGDILILVRKRPPFAPAMVAALEARRVPVAGADRLRLSEQIAVDDLVALGDVLALPDDDLKLAALLKSPLFGFDDDDLLRLAPARKGSLWSELVAQGANEARCAEAAGMLSRWREEARAHRPFEFYAGVLDRDGGRSRLLARLGSEAADPIDEFMSLALAYEAGAAPSLAGFLQSLRASDREIKRDMEQGRDAVRVMTVHGAKGLEAPIVFLPDTCGVKPGGRNSGLIRLAGVEGVAGPELFAWAVKGASRHGAIAEARAQRDELERRERHRLLYVAMTRARDRLYVAGYEGKDGRSEGCWYDLVRDALDPILARVDAPDGATVWRLTSPQAAEPEAARAASGVADIATPRPPWAMRAAPIDPRAPVPATPSGLVAYEKHGAGPSAAASLSEGPRPQSDDDESRFVRGTLTHALLEHLPSLPPETWERVAPAYIARRGESLDGLSQAEAVAEALRILRDPAFAPLFGPESRPEVPINALLERPQDDGPPIRLLGQIDRLAKVGDEFLIIDYKTNRAAPNSLAETPDAYIFQLAAYRLVLKRIFVNSPVRAAILWTGVPRLMEIPADVLDGYEARFWTLASTLP